MTIYHHNEKATELQCLVDPSQKCVSEKCHAWMYRQYDDNGKKRTDSGSGVCGWTHVMAYFRDKNPNKML